MSKRVDVAVIGAVSPIAEAVLEQLAERRFPANEISVLALDPEEGATISFLDRPLFVEDARSFDFAQVQLVFLADADPELAAQAERAADAGAVVVDACNLSWSDPAIPLVVSSVNAGALAQFNERGIVGAPDRVTVGLLPVLSALHAAFELRELQLTGLLAASDFGRAALEDLARETTALLNVRFYERRHYAQQIAFNLIAQDSDAGDDGETEREHRVAAELAWLLGLPQLPAAVSLVAAPVFYGHSFAVTAHFARPLSVETARQALAAVPELQLSDARTAAEVPTPVRDAALDAAPRVARLRVGPGPQTLQFWLSVDNIRWCAAHNAVLNAELLVRDHL